MDITFKFTKTPYGSWIINWTEDDKFFGNQQPSRTKAVNKMHRLAADNLRSKDSFEVTYHIPS